MMDVYVGLVFVRVVGLFQGRLDLYQSTAR